MTQAQTITPLRQRMLDCGPAWGILARVGLIPRVGDGSVDEPGMFAARSGPLGRRYLGGTVPVAGGVVVVVAGGVPWPKRPSR